jgi:hypothetical protein
MVGNPGPKKKISSRASIRHSYESVLSACARLYGYSTGQISKNKGPVGRRQDVLAQEDLAAFAIHARRLIEGTITAEAALKVTVEGMYEKERGDIPITRILNAIIHHKAIEVHSHDMEIQLARLSQKFGKFDLDDPDFLHEAASIKPSAVPPYCIVTSDRGYTAAFRIKDLIDRFEDDILVPIIDYCEERKLYLDDPLED